MTTSVCSFLAEYAACMLRCGATCIRIRKNVARMAGAFGVEAQVAIMPRHVHVAVREAGGGRSQYETCWTQGGGISFRINSELSKLSWEVADGKADFAQACHAFEQIRKAPCENRWLVLLLASLANASFCRLFGGDAVSMLVVFSATLAGYFIKQVMLENKADVRVAFLCSAFFSAVIASGCHVFGWGGTPEIALGTSVLYLIPGIPYINSVSDMLEGHYVCAFSRFMDAVVLTTCLTAGLCGGLFLMGLKML